MPLPTCTGNCTNPPLPFSFDLCAPIINGGQIDTFYITQIGNPMTDWTDTAEWTARIDNTAANADAILAITVVASKAAPTANEVELSGCRSAVISKEHIINYRIDETNKTNLAWFRNNECGGAYLLLGFRTVSGLLFGYENDGIKVSMTGDIIIPESKDELIVVEGTLKWDSKFSPTCIASPIAA